MLLKVADLAGIKAGTLSLAFRRWKSPRVKVGTLLKTPIGQVEVMDIFEIDPASIGEKQAREAGFSTLEALMKVLNKRRDGRLYQIQLRYHSPDPRLTLRENAALSAAELAELKSKLARFDAYSKHGPWTLHTLQAIRAQPQRKAQLLAEQLGVDKDWLKPNIRKLKNLGLTISHGVGYSLSPRGERLLTWLEAHHSQ